MAVMSDAANGAPATNEHAKRRAINGGIAVTIRNKVMKSVRSSERMFSTEGDWRFINSDMY